MTRICLPRPRKRNFLHRLWLAPTNLVGLAIVRTLRCEDQGNFGGDMTPAKLFFLPEGRLSGLGAIALGHVILAERRFLSGEDGALILAHELSHTRQHDFLGPLYLPVHGFLQLLSTLVSLVRPVNGYPPMHAYNPLERALLCVPFDVIARGAQTDPLSESAVHSFGLGTWRAKA